MVDDFTEVIEIGNDRKFGRWNEQLENKFHHIFYVKFFILLRTEGLSMLWFNINGPLFDEAIYG
jgi:hypothetical protein